MPKGEPLKRGPRSCREPWNRDCLLKTRVKTKPRTQGGELRRHPPDEGFRFAPNWRRCCLPRVPPPDGRPQQDLPEGSILHMKIP